jgi:DNA transposition AAA+ family ATPase
MNSLLSDFVVTHEYRRFAEFCDACRRYHYIGLCYGSPGVGKTLSARHYANWADIEASRPVQTASDTALASLLESCTVLYTPGVINSPAQVEREIGRLRSELRSIRIEERSRLDHLHLDEARRQEEAVKEKRWQHMFTETDRFAESFQDEFRKTEPSWVHLSIASYQERLKIDDPTTLVMIDEADRLKMNALEQVRDIFDRGGIGVVLIGMPGIEKRLSRYPQLYSRVGFVHAFRPLSAAQVRDLLQQKWAPSGATLPEAGVTDEEALAAIIRVTGGNFRLLHRLLTQMARIVEINGLQTVTSEVVEAARESLVIGTS